MHLNLLYYPILEVAPESDSTELTSSISPKCLTKSSQKPAISL